MHELRTEKPWQHGVGPGFNSRRLHAEAPVPPYGAGAFLYILGFIVGCSGPKRLSFGDSGMYIWHECGTETVFGPGLA